MHEIASTEQLRGILGSEGLVRLVEFAGGTRLYVPIRPSAGLIDALGAEAAERLSQALAPAWIRVPLARADRVIAYRAQGLSNAAIARRLGVTETAVSKIVAKARRLPNGAEAVQDKRQLKLL